MADISAIKLPNGNTYNIKDNISGFITGMTILSYGNSTWQDFLNAYNANRVVYCRASSNSDPASGSQTRLAFMAYVDNATTPTNVEFQYYRSVSTHSDSQQGDQVYVYKLTNTGSWSVTVREAYSKIAVSGDISKSYSSGTITLSSTETDPIFSASPAAGITSADIESWNAKVSDDKTWNGVTLKSTTASTDALNYIPAKDSTTLSGDARWFKATSTPTAYAIAKFDDSAFLKSTTPSANDNSTKVATTAYVDSAITALPEPMIFKGSLGTGGTITSLPAASSSNEGFTYKVITAGTYASQSAKVGDTFISDGSSWVLIPSGDEPSGTVTSVGVSNATDGGLSVSGSPITSSGTITVGHSNILTNAQTTQAVYPIKIDKNGHISEYGSAVTIPVVPTNTGNSATGVSIADHSTTSIYGVGSSTTVVTGVSGSTSVYGVKSGTNSTTIASKASGSNGTASNWAFEEKSIPNVTAVGSGSASLTFTMDSTDTKKLNIAFSHTHNAPTLGTVIKVQSKSSGSNGTAPTWSFSDVTVPIRADSATTVPIADISGTVVPIKNGTATTVVTSKTHSVTDNGHTHTI